MDDDRRSEPFQEAFVEPGNPAAALEVADESLDDDLEAFDESDNWLELILASIVAV